LSDETGGPVKSLNKSAIKLLKKYRFPGNVRELKNIMERLNIYCEADIAGKKTSNPFWVKP